MAHIDLRGAHLGDILMALPALRRGDQVLVDSGCRVPEAPVVWLDEHTSQMHGFGPGGPLHFTQWWLDKLQRKPQRHQLLPAVAREHLIIAPLVREISKQWHGWLGLKHLKARWLGETESRQQWMAALNSAHTVVCPDTGTAHMADALGVPRVIALYANRNLFERCKPYWTQGSSCLIAEQITIKNILEKVNG